MVCLPCASFTNSSCHPDLSKHHGGCCHRQGASVLRRAGCADVHRKLGDNSARPTSPRLRVGHVPLRYEPQLTETATHSDAILEPNTICRKEPLANHRRLLCTLLLCSSVLVMVCRDQKLMAVSSIAQMRRSPRTSIFRAIERSSYKNKPNE